MRADGALATDPSEVPRILRSRSARRDLDDIWDHLADAAGVEIADAILARIIEGIHRAADRPQIYRPRVELPGAPRRANVLRYAIFFDILPEGDGIFVWRVVHGSRDLPRVVLRPDDVD